MYDNPDSVQQSHDRLSLHNAHRITYNSKKTRPSKARETRLIRSARLKIMLVDLGLNADSAGKMLHVHPRTVRYWISGKTLIPYSAYKLLCVLTGSELPCTGWEGWKIKALTSL